MGYIVCQRNPAPYICELSVATGAISFLKGHYLDN